MNDATPTAIIAPVSDHGVGQINVARYAAIRPITKPITPAIIDSLIGEVFLVPMSEYGILSIKNHLDVIIESPDKEVSARGFNSSSNSTEYAGSTQQTLVRIANQNSGFSVNSTRSEEVGS
jgi:hypothetical protein